MSLAYLHREKNIGAIGRAVLWKEALSREQSLNPTQGSFLFKSCFTHASLSTLHAVYITKYGST